MPNAFAFFIVTGCLMAGTAHAQRLEAAALVTPFSSARPGAALPANWEHIRLGSSKTPTVYGMVDDQGQVVLHARAESAASLLIHPVRLDINASPVIQWRWKIGSLIDNADNAEASREDSPARILLSFAGDRSVLSLKEKASSAVAKSVTGRDLPYAELMYIWSNKAPVGTVIANPHTKRIQMVVANSGSAGVGQWVNVRRNVVEDFRRAFNEAPGLLAEVGVFTDTDNTGATVEAWYGDIRFVAGP